MAATDAESIMAAKMPTRMAEAARQGVGIGVEWDGNGRMTGRVASYEHRGEKPPILLGERDRM